MSKNSTKGPPRERRKKENFRREKEKTKREILGPHPSPPFWPTPLELPPQPHAHSTPGQQRDHPGQLNTHQHNTFLFSRLNYGCLSCRCLAPMSTHNLRPLLWKKSGERLLRDSTDSPTSTRPTDKKTKARKKTRTINFKKQKQTINSQKPKSLHTTKTSTLPKVGLAKVGRIRMAKVGLAKVGFDRRVGGPKFRAFFSVSSPCHSSFSWRSSRGILVVFEAPGRKCARLEFSDCRVKPQHKQH